MTADHGTEPSAHLQADVDEEDRLRRDGANVGGATGPVESDEQKAPEPADTSRGAVGGGGA